jgi:hypothetical protein
MSGMVYLIQPEELLGTDEYKIGMSNSSSIRRVRSYGYDSDCIATWKCSNPSEVEQYLIQAFQTHFGWPTMGREYFRGNELEMIKVFQDCIQKHATYAMPVIDKEIILQRCKDTLLKFSKTHIDRVINKNTKQSLYEFLMLLSDDWYTDIDKLQMIVFALRNSAPVSGYTEIVLKATFKRVCIFRSSNYYDNRLYELFDIEMNSRQQRITLGSIENKIREYGDDRLLLWKHKWHKSKQRKLIFKEGNMVCLKDAKDIFSNKRDCLKPERLSRINPSIVIEKKTVCRSCNQLYKSKCCTDSKRSTRLFIMNVDIAYKD